MAKKRGAETLFFVLFLDCWQGSNTGFSSSSKNWDEGLSKLFGSNTGFSSSSKNWDEGLSKLFDEILQQVFYKVPYGTPFDEARTASKSITKRDMNSEIFIKGTSVPGYSTAPRFLLGSMDRISINDVQNKNVPCAQLLQFLQRNIIIAAASVAGILVVTVLLVLALTTCIRRKQLSHPPANMTYNIFILNGKTWWQKIQEKNPGKHSDKQEQLLKSKSRV
ncbi:uncharacterized protein C2orf92 homolog isoform X2 [Mirounga angustirostris]|uniref:uncharacterized protein C2orf92 homolog isoform X2 n=1 Tax=Mirounga angustirostris TaxID=9716 RepID=UPI00313E5726